MSAIRLAFFGSFVSVLVSSTPAQAGPILDWFCGCSSNLRSESTYTPAYIPTAVVPAQPAGCISPQPTTTYYAPTAIAPAPVTAYRVVPETPRPRATYLAANYNPYSAAPVTVYRPVVPAVQPLVTTTRLIPYTTYRREYPTTVSYYGYGYVAPPVAPVVTYPAPVTETVVPNVVPPVAPVESYDAPTTIRSSDDAANEVPSLPPQQSTTANYPPLPLPSPVIVEKPADVLPPTTRQDNKPVASPEAQPAPSNENKSANPEINPRKTNDPKSVQPNSLQNTQPDDSQDRTTMRPVRQAARTTPLAIQPTVRVLSEDLWRPAKD
jgi:hypothetical protein